MPRPAHLAYGLLTVVLFTVAVLLAADVRSGAGVVAVAAAGLVLGVGVATALTVRGRRAAVVVAPPVRAVTAVLTSARVPRARVRAAAAEARQHSLRG